ncbi:transketolase [Roseivivax sp. GX 12232]|uniref:transketolase family protein n=1 Tax=Roseivivax sp. GX 12232 TaxID=2900547 RepID=UPI001E2E350A|nr:transketolase C-terminal domain-containing protein [Roseivivax sp. GX 12232]MCE0506582.1 transketolase [Roseivivax sp. GX 12232]
MRDAFLKELTRQAAEDPSVMLITGDLGFGVLTEYSQRFPNQFINAGVAEQNMTAMACGLAMEGYRVFTYSIANFTTLRCLEQIRNDVCYHDADVTVVSIGGGFSYGQLGVSHFATEDLAILRALPNMTVIAPTDPWEAEELARQLPATPGPKYMRIDKGAAGLAPDPGSISLGRARRVREGADATVICVGGILSEALQAAEILAREGIELRVVGIHTLKPLDTEEVTGAARDTGGIVTLEEHSIIGGLGGVVAETLLEAGCAPGFFRRMGLHDIYPSVVGDQNFLRAEYGMDAAAVVATLRKALCRDG